MYTGWALAGLGADVGHLMVVLCAGWGQISSVHRLNCFMIPTRTHHVCGWSCSQSNRAQTTIDGECCPRVM